MNENPYFIIPAIDELAEATGERRLELARIIAASVGDDDALRAILGIDPEEFAHFYPDLLPPQLSTEDTISSFIDHFAPNRANQPSEAEAIITAPAIDYASMIDESADDLPDEEQNAEPDQTANAIDAFLSAVPPKTPKRTGKNTPKTAPQASQPETPNPGADTPQLSEALFKLMVKNHNYQKALEIIQELSLNNPKKSIYFAYQMRFLKKLIENQKSADS